jgi:hypothetical protein
LTKTEKIGQLFSEIHEQLNNPNDSQMNRAAIFLRLLEINKKVELLFDQSEVGFGPKQMEAPMIPSGPNQGKKENIHPTSQYKNPTQSDQFGKFRNQIMGLDPKRQKQKFMDMNDVVDMHSDKDLPDFLHKLNLRLNLYDPDLKFVTINKKYFFNFQIRKVDQMWNREIT